MILVFDAQCLLCQRSVQFLLRHDHRRVFQFASIQGRTGQALLAQAGLAANGLQTLLLVDGAVTRQNTAALLHIAHALGWPWRAAWLAWLVPAPWRDGAYRWLAKNRLALFGTAASCLVPSPEDAARFLD